MRSLKAIATKELIQDIVDDEDFIIEYTRKHLHTICKMKCQKSWSMKEKILWWFLRGSFYNADRSFEQLLYTSLALLCDDLDGEYAISQQAIVGGKYAIRNSDNGIVCSFHLKRKKIVFYGHPYPYKIPFENNWFSPLNYTDIIELTLDNLELYVIPYMTRVWPILLAYLK
jgi:hypothetical protein